MLEAQAEILEDGPRLALVRLRLQLGEALGSIDTAAQLGGEFGDVGLLARRLQAAGGRAAGQLDTLLRAKATAAPVVAAVRTQVREIEALAERLAETAAGVIGGAADVEFGELRAGLEEQVAVVEARTTALRNLTRRR